MIFQSRFGAIKRRAEKGTSKSQPEKEKGTLMSNAPPRVNRPALRGKGGAV